MNPELIKCIIVQSQTCCMYVQQKGLANDIIKSPSFIWIVEYTVASDERNLSLMGIKNLNITAYHTQYNGMVELYPQVRVLEACFRVWDSVGQVPTVFSLKICHSNFRQI